MRRAFVVEAGQIGEAARLARAQKSRAVQPDIDEGRLHAGQHALHAAQNDVADQAVAAAAAAALALDAPSSSRWCAREKLLQPAVFHEGDANFPGPGIDQDFLVHRIAFGE